MSKVSVIIPVYNTSKYIEKCLDSIVNQTMKDIEIIVINDGSTDNSKEVIMNYINKHEATKIKYYEKKNGGLSDSRNYGVRKATGKYISFIDSDDYINENLYKNLEKYMDDEVDLIKFKMQTVDENNKLIEKLDGPTFEACNGEEAFQKLCTEDFFLEVACIYLYKRSFFLENNFKYEIGTYHEDFGLTPFVIARANSVVSTNEFGYYYLQSDNSIMRNEDYNKTIKKANDVLKHYDNAIKRINESVISKKTKILLKRYYTNTVILKAKELKDKEQEKYLKELKQRKLYKNIKPYNIKQLIKKMILRINIKIYLKMR